MATKSKTREITIVEKKGSFDAILKRFTKEAEENTEYDFEGISALRKLLSNEKARLINTIKTKNPSSIYNLSKILKRDFKSVAQDIKLLERFGLIDLIAEKTGKRERLKPILTVDSLYISLKF